MVIYLADNSPFNSAVFAAFASAITLNTTASRFAFPSKYSSNLTNSTFSPLLNSLNLNGPEPIGV